MNLHPDVREFADALRELEIYLRTYDQPDWAYQIALCATSVERSDYFGVERYLGLLGGMGSLNDLVLHRDGHWLSTENDELHALLARVGKMASALHGHQRRVG